MTLSNSNSGPNRRNGETLQTKTGWGWLMAYGLLVMLIGAVAFLNPLSTGLATGIFLSVMLLIFGVTAIATGFSTLSRRARWIEILLGAFSILAAVLTFLNPFAGALSLVALIGAWLFIIGIFEVAGATRSPHDRVWRIVLGVVDMVLGLVLLFSDPATGLAFLAITVGISFLLRGAFLVVLALGLRRAETL